MKIKQKRVNFKTHISYFRAESIKYNFRKILKKDTEKMYIN